MTAKVYHIVPYCTNHLGGQVCDLDSLHEMEFE